jgi:hypothetical protein
MTEYPIVVRELGGEKRVGVEDAEEFEADLREVVVDAYERVDIEACADGEQVGTVVAASDTEIESIEWEA